ncbi:conserved hypothetical protein [Shewanella sediminis HAW-EB3]|uniref:Uncharacterized protein n=1 Tax=Shewanella sediminis (strain HAW-EB3) TaxID=425104 RepID=A8FX90_SHESH|nr:putative DNA-binding domain-containing protein [Shewanella sediminis]ABV37463.1 conserved hypothetical protein [Shewanella sediminis HAW-EB3]
MSFTKVQQSFIDYIKEPSRQLPIGTESRRMKIYRDLFFNNIDSFISSGFPVLKSLYSQDAWQALVQDFFVTHDCQSPIFIDIAKEFVIFLQSEYELKAHDPGFLLELAHYEYMELVISVAKDNPSQGQITGNVAAECLCLSDTAKVLQYSYDVEHISEHYQPQSPTPTPQYFCLYRDSEDEVVFLRLNPLAAQVLGYLSQSENVTFDTLVAWLFSTYPDMEENILIKGCREMIEGLAHKGAIKEDKR